MTEITEPSMADTETMTAHGLADAILKAAGSRLLHYETHSKQMILNAAGDAIDAIRRSARAQALGEARNAVVALPGEGLSVHKPYIHRLSAEQSILALQESKP